MEDAQIRVEFKASQSLMIDCPESYFNKYEYDVFLSIDVEKEIFIGKGIAVLYLYGKAMDEGVDIIEAFDENHHNGVYDILFDGNILAGTKGLKREWDEIMLDSYSLNILVSDRLEILPAYRHKGYGNIVREIKRSFFSGCYFIEVLHSFPLQLEGFKNDENEWRAAQQYELMEQDSKKAFASLNRCYKKDGYKRYKRTEYFYRIP